ncbi:hypothetical protein CCR75_008084 [Bremia lactucae]|uniref:Uncharacterized protein n=1 Tax=Bremia lactucae TaxID=4779 RepID=A0A976IKH9_BRELC|nr:hypothetical protein CCR75_008084 [Bremia lactucae]
MDHMTIKSYVGSVFGIHYANMWTHFGYVFIFIAVIRLLALLSLRFLNHQKSRLAWTVCLIDIEFVSFRGEKIQILRMQDEFKYI